MDGAIRLDVSSSTLRYDVDDICGMRIALLAAFPLHEIPTFSEQCLPVGHYATWLPQLARAFAAYRDLDVHWVVVSDSVRAYVQVRELGQEFHILPTTPRGRASSLYRHDLECIHRLLRRLTPDCVHGWGTEDVYGLAAVTCGFRSIVSMQGILSFYALKSKMELRTYFQALIELYVVTRAETVTTESNWGLDILRKRRPFGRTEVVEYGVNPLFFDYTWRPNPLRPRVAFVGGITPRKGIDDLVAAFRDPRLASVELVVAGSGHGRWANALQASAPRNISWLGRREPGEIAQLLAGSWCLALPSRGDTSPNVVKEARVIGLPVITSKHGGQSDYIMHGENGFIIENRDVAGLIHRLERITSNYDLTIKLGSCGHLGARDHFQPDRTASLFHELYTRRHLGPTVR